MAAGRPQQIPISKIQMDARTQARVQMDMEALANYTEEYKQRTKFPPVVLFLDPTGRHYWIGDGFHRVQAARQAGHKSIAAVIKRGTVEDAAWFSLQANRTNGVRFNSADRSKAIDRAIQLRPKLSDKAIADHIGVTAMTVGRHRAELERQNKVLPASTREARDGRSMGTSAIGRSTITKVIVDDAVSSNPDPIPPDPDDPPQQGFIDDSMPPEMPTTDVVAEPLPGEIPQGNSEPPPPFPDDPPPEDEPLRDKVGNAVPEGRIAEGFRREHELVELRSTILRVKKQILDAVDACDPLYLDVNVNAFTIEIDNAHRWISHTRPFAICPYCWGDNRDCEACKGRGWVNEITYKRAPSEMKVVRT